MSASRLRVKSNRLSYSEQTTITFNLLHLMLVQKITFNTEGLNAPFSEELKLQIEDEVCSETHHV